MGKIVAISFPYFPYWFPMPPSWFRCQIREHILLNSKSGTENVPSDKAWVVSLAIMQIRIMIEYGITTLLSPYWQK